MIIKREIYLKKLRPLYDNNLIKVILGPRRSGKSEILKMIRNELYSLGINDDHVIYINFEDVSFEELLDYRMLNSYVNNLVKDKNKYYLMFDEIQHVDEFEKVIASFKATLNCSIFITGSNSNLLKGSLASLLTGRCLEFYVRPFTYKESLDYLVSLGKKIPNDFFERNYLKWGGFPQRFDFADESQLRQYLNQLYLDTIEKDIINMSRRDKKKSNLDKNKFKTISSYVLATAGQEFSPSSIEEYLHKEKGDLNITANTIRTYLELMEKAFLIQRIDRYSIKGKRKLKMLPKYYALDNGMRVIQNNSGAYLSTFFLENIICNELISRGYEVSVGKKYNGEIDFVAEQGGKHCYIQVAYYLTKEKGPDEKKSAFDREYDAFDSIKDGSPRYVMSLDKIDTSHNGITHLNIEDFLLNKVDIKLS